MLGATGRPVNVYGVWALHGIAPGKDCASPLRARGDLLRALCRLLAHGAIYNPRLCRVSQSSQVADALLRQRPTRSYEPERHRS